MFSTKEQSVFVTNHIRQMLPDGSEFKVIQRLQLQLLIEFTGTPPSDIVKRFSWLANWDVGLQQQLCNHFASLDQPILLQGLAERLPLFLQHIRSSVGTSVVQNFKIGNHEVILHFESVPGKIKAGNPPGSTPTNGSSQGGYGCLIWIVAGILSIILWANK